MCTILFSTYEPYLCLFPRRLPALPNLQAQRNALGARLQDTQVQHQRCITELEQRKEALNSAAAARSAAFEAQRSLREEEMAALTARLPSACAARNERYQALQQLHNTHGAVVLAALLLSVYVNAHRAPVSCCASTAELEQQAMKLALEVQGVKEGGTALTQEQGLQEGKVVALQRELDASRVKLAEVQQAAQEAQRGENNNHRMPGLSHNGCVGCCFPANEKQYELTCLRMIQLREAHQQQAALSLLLHQVCTSTALS